MTAPLGPLKEATLEATLLTGMAQALRDRPDLDLSDDAEVIRALSAAGFRSGDIVALSDRAAEKARTAQSVAEGDYGHTLDPAWGGR
jgi:hypothetical protein